MKFSEQLVTELKPVWEANHNHPFVKELAAGKLATNKFKFYMVQDYVYLIDYAKLFALGALKANDLTVEGKFAELLSETLNTEMGLHRSYAKEFGIRPQELATANPTPTTLSYTNYMLSVGQSGGLDKVLVALLPCMWSYNQIGKQLVDTPAATHPLYSKWVAMYADDNYTELTNWTIGLLDQVTEGQSKGQLAELTKIFLNTTRYEYLFWDMAYYHRDWPIVE
ncbi:thiaminase II [Lactobacillus sp. Sy-1]|uniref:thiaminase II n=1 Tax=Lactobacillus sp. Sy-1 TaxID=2109645 RepID=UPI001C5B5309|nr:thiaminase II [Lactobacillus sp. Sy-1]MBW1606251.1 thiaminase II [Lactobacillus sp. Sy-1]